MTAPHDHEAAIRQLLASLVDGLRAKDLGALRALYATDVVSFDVEPPLQHVGVESKLATWTTVFATFDTLDYELRDLALTVDDRVAYGHAFGRLSGALHGGATTPGTWVRATFCLRRDGDRWLVAHDQVSLPVDLRTGAAATGLEP
ncbi:YybH family protein [Krasilnikoviella flava]|uniref:Ketosteroid isomerase homolog n=1 Tax=Krasilnikoviella flava TaxID=526729 RepID=A0A1T5LHM1_9MICO|nr:nuclear transport factor 2 family protein [Krasilnikoviella flava]SKC75490.1 Ketosteroid isomerase homolog [Krasilnikoviella flava]